MWSPFSHKENVKGFITYENRFECNNITSPVDNISKYFPPKKFYSILYRYYNIRALLIAKFIVNVTLPKTGIKQEETLKGYFILRTLGSHLGLL